MRGQVPVVKGDRVIASALGGIDAQLVADVGDVLGHTPAAADVMDAGRRWGTTPSGVLLRILERAYPPPREGWGLTTHVQQAPPRGRRTRRGKEQPCRH